MQTLLLMYNCETNELKNCSSNMEHFENDNYEMFVMGTVSTEISPSCEISNTLIYQRILSLFSDNPRAITSRIYGLYLLSVYNKQTREIYVYQGRNTSPTMLYYTKQDNTVYIGTGLKTILDVSKKKYVLYDSSVKEFLYNGFVGGEKTLLKDVYKLDRKMMLYLSGGGIRQIPAEYDWDAASDLQPNDDNWKKTIHSAIERSMRKCPKIYVPLSGGYDSNYILHVASQNRDKITCISIGGRSGRSETAKAEEISKYYNNVSFFQGVTSGSTLGNMADIVRRLEGACFEIGVFLQYELYNELHNKGASSAICGECADEVMNENYIHSFECTHNEQYYGSRISYMSDPFSIGTQLVLKKSSMMANSFGIRTYYPYMDDLFVCLCQQYAKVNGTEKRLHKRICKEELRDEVGALIEKNSGSTDAISLFSSGKDVRAFIKTVEKGYCYRTNKNLVHTIAGMPERNSLVRKAVTQAHRLVQRCTGNGYNERLQIENRHLEKKLRVYLTCSYLDEFKRQFAD